MSAPNPELEELYRRVIADPHSATRADRNAVFGRPPPDEEDRLCVARTGQTLAELVEMASTYPQKLTLEESKIVSDSRGVLFDKLEALSSEEQWENLTRSRQEPSPLEALRAEAELKLIAIRTEEEKRTLLNAIDRRLAIEQEKNDVDLQAWRDFEASMRLRRGTPWILKLLKQLQEDGAECWGFVVFRTGCYRGAEDEVAWQKFREYLLKVAETSILHYNSGPLLWPKLRVVFVEDRETLDGASNEQLRARFRKMRDGHGGEHLPKGIRTTCFLVADKTVIDDAAAKAPYVPRYASEIRLDASVNIRLEDPTIFIRAVDPDYKIAAAAIVEKESQDGDDAKEGEAMDDESGTSSGAEKADTTDTKQTIENYGDEMNDEMNGFEGEATLMLAKVFDWLHYVCFVTEHGGGVAGVDQREGWWAIHVQTTAPAESWILNLAPNTGGLLYAHVPRMSI